MRTSEEAGEAADDDALVIHDLRILATEEEAEVFGILWDLDLQDGLGDHGAGGDFNLAVRRAGLEEGDEFVDFHGVLVVG